MKVVKFGGSSVASAAQLKKVANIITSDEERRIVVVSAPGKRFAEDIKVTDLFINLFEALMDQNHVESSKEKIIDRFQLIVSDLNLPSLLLEDLSRRIDEVLYSNELLDVEKLDSLKAMGEDTLARVLSAYLETLGLKATYLNPMDAGIIVSNDPGKAQVLPESYDRLLTLRERDGITVIPGFFGYTTEGKLMTFPRGGSDITGSIVAAGVQASLYENFTDVDSVFCVNPSIVEQPKEIKVLTYKEMRELSYAGFSVFHDEALIPAFRAKIPVCIKNTNDPTKPGTMILSERSSEEQIGPVVGIASARGFISIYVGKYLMNREKGFGRRLLQILEEEGISFEHVPSGIDDLSVILREEQMTPEKERRVIDRIKTDLQADTVNVERNLAMIMIVGEGMDSAIGVAAKATEAFARANVNIEMINQGSSEVSMMFGVKEESIIPAVRSLYEQFFVKELV
ncbi:aspartate kinase [Bacillaceae bacterium S4-13-58]